jgi:hypothetical protein
MIAFAKSDDFTSNRLSSYCWLTESNHDEIELHIEAIVAEMVAGGRRQDRP